MNLYESVLKSVKEAKTIASHITALGKVRNQTEDKVLLGKIDCTIVALQEVHATVKAGKSTPICLDKAKDFNVKALIEYCQKKVENKKPEWQVIAERNGWAPKNN